MIKGKFSAFYVQGIGELVNPPHLGCGDSQIVPEYPDNKHIKWVLQYDESNGIVIIISVVPYNGENDIGFLGNDFKRDYANRLNALFFLEYGK